MDLAKEFERVSKKQKTSFSVTSDQIDKLIEELRNTQRELSAGETSMDTGSEEWSQVHSSVPLTLSKLRKAFLESSIVNGITQEQKDLHSAISKFGKAIDKVMHTDLSKACRPHQFESQVLHEVIAEHLFRQGKFNLGKKFVEESQVRVGSAMMGPFMEMYQVLQAIKVQRLEPALEWARSRRQQLVSNGSSLEFKLHRLHYLHLLHQSHTEEALQYARQHFPPFASTQMTEISRLMGCLAYVNRLESSPYKDLVNPAQWHQITHAFTTDSCTLLGLSHDSPLFITITAGAAALPTLLKLASVMHTKNSEWNTCDHLPVEMEVAKELHFHSMFACPVSREQSTADNPPMLLPCGHVICKQSMHKLARPTSTRFKCPYCPSEQTTSQAKQIFF